MQREGHVAENSSFLLDEEARRLGEQFPTILQVRLPCHQHENAFDGADNISGSAEGSTYDGSDTCAL